VLHLSSDNNYIKQCACFFFFVKKGCVFRTCGDFNQA